MTIQSLIGLYGITGNDDPNMETFNSDGLGNDTSVNAHYKLWPTQYCNEFGAYLDDKNVYPNVDRTNDYYGGLDIRTGNILWVNGNIDPWHWLSNYRSAPGLNQDLVLVRDGHHCSELYGRSEYTKGVFDQIFKVYDKWLL
ncbi:hypothetical protein HDU76_008912 [Blyttiomyces sp. JEL0837]|nr:hypothetical protein HDU76_008912 [Blyttiomyces sp. JEL0837]